MQKRKVCLYVRVSTENQQGGMESQIRALKEWCFRNQINDYELFIDEGISGAKESRPSLNRLMELVEQNEVEQVVVFSFSRFARSTSHLLKALQKFKERDTRFISITESIDTNSPLGIALYTILGALAQLEREMICERVRAGMNNAKAKGKRIGRTKLRNSVLIRSLLEAKISYREIARIAKCSHGSVHAEKIQMQKEQDNLLRKKMEDLQDEILKSNSMDALNDSMLTPEEIQEIHEKCEAHAKAKVEAFQGTYYETVD
jgi:DNA invertase Pin-like site-specific DNA recombinase